MDQATDETVITCRFCGNEQGSRYDAAYMKRIVAAQLCFSCLYWEEDIAGSLMDPEAPAFVARYPDGRHQYYCIAPEFPYTQWGRGFGGAKYLFRNLATGALFATSNAWNGSEVPAHWRNDPRFKPTFEGISRTNENEELFAKAKWDSYPKYRGGARKGW
jgi:hypothetical protein